MFETKPASQPKFKLKALGKVDKKDMRTIRKGRNNNRFTETNFTLPWFIKISNTVNPPNETEGWRQHHRKTQTNKKFGDW